MIALDASLLAYAVNRFAPEHARAARVVEDLANGDRPWALPWPAVHEFLGVVTHPHVVARPLGPGDAWGFVESLMASETVHLLSPTARHGEVLAELLAGAGAGAEPGMPAGLEIAVVLREHGVRDLLSADRGMRRFAFLSVQDPVHGDAWSAEARPARRYRMLKPR